MTKARQAHPSLEKGVSYKEISAAYRADLDRAEDALRDNFRSDVALIPDISAYLTGGGGKRIRPLLVIVTSKLCGYTGGSRHIDCCVVVEYIHAATLLHDDVVDEADIRRGAQSANVRYGNQASVLVGDFLFANAFHLMSSAGDIRVVNCVADATKSLAEGEVLQLVNTGDVEISEKIYMDTIFRKTGALIMSCCQIGALLGGVSGEKENALAAYGKNVGIAFQLMDDALDYTADTKRWGKPLGADLAEGKVTLPLIRANARADQAGRAVIKSALNPQNDPKDFFSDVLDIIKDSGALDYTRSMAMRYAEQARSALALFDPSPHLDALGAIADYIVERDV